MMIKYIPFSMFDAFDNIEIQTIVNTINCVGIMGKGLALEFKIRYPEMFDDYRKRFEEGLLKPGEPYLFKARNKWILNFPTKNHWRYPSSLKLIDSGLKYFNDNFKEWEIKSIAFPRLGCTSGGLQWEQVKPVMEKYLEDININIYVYLDQEISDRERSIIDLINSCDKVKIKERLKLSERQIKSLQEYIQKKGNLKKHRDLLEIKNIGPIAYKKSLEGLSYSKSSQGEFLF